MSQSVISPGATVGVQKVPVSAERDGQRLDNFLMARLRALPKSAIYRIIRTGQVRVNGKRSKPRQRLNAGDEVRIPPVRINPEAAVVIADEQLKRVAARIVYEDNDRMVINKPAGMAVHGGSGLSWGVVDVVRRLRPGRAVDLVHRLDRETSGCLLLALNGSALNELSQQFRANQVQKRYLCLVAGRPAQARFEIDAPLASTRRGGEKRMQVDARGKTAVTRFRVLQQFATAAYCEVELLTGRTHQIRVHAAHAGHALYGDRKYSSPGSVADWRARGLGRLFLHAHEIILSGQQGEAQIISAPLDVELKTAMDQLEDQ